MNLLRNKYPNFVLKKKDSNNRHIGISTIAYNWNRKIIMLLISFINNERSAIIYFARIGFKFLGF